MTSARDGAHQHLDNDELGGTRPSGLDNRWIRQNHGLQSSPKLVGQPGENEVCLMDTGVGRGWDQAKPPVATRVTAAKETHDLDAHDGA